MTKGQKHSPETVERLRRNHSGGGSGGSVPYQRSAVLALCQFPDPNKPDRGRWRATTQAVHTKLGGGSIDFKKNLVLSSVLAKLRKRVGGTLTKENITAWANNSYGASLVNGDYTQPRMALVEEKPTVAERIIGGLEEYADQLASAKKFCHAVGAANAKDVLNTYLRVFEDSP